MMISVDWFTRLSSSNDFTGPFRVREIGARLHIQSFKMTLYTSLPCLAFNGCGITSHDDFFGEMINCLPAQQYFPLADDDNHVFAKFHKVL